jgi:hypothetical protein
MNLVGKNKNKKNKKEECGSTAGIRHVLVLESLF